MKKNEATSNYHWIELEYGVPEWSDTEELEPYFKYKKSIYYLSEVLSFHAFSSNYKGYWDGYITQSNWGGLVVKVAGSGDAVQVGYSYK